MANHNLPVITSLYVDYTAELKARHDDALLMLDPATTTPTNVPANAIRFSSAAAKWQKWNGSSWVDLVSSYAINASTATTLQTARTINGVSFNGSANISVNANNAVTFSNAGAGAASGASYNGGAALTVSYNTVGAPSTGGAGATGTWGISISGNAATATNASNVTSISGAVGSEYSWTGVQRFLANQNTASGSNAPLQAFSSSGGAIMAFHRAGVFGLNMGLDSDNVFRIGGWSAAVNRLQLDMSGNLTVSGNSTGFSDERLKEDWKNLPRDFLPRLAKVKSGTYTRKDSGERQAGSSAQDWQNLLPEVVCEGADEMHTLSLAYGNAALVSCIELAKEVIALRAEIDALKAR